LHFYQTIPELGPTSFVILTYFSPRLQLFSFRLLLLRIFTTKATTTTTTTTTKTYHRCIPALNRIIPGLNKLQLIGLKVSRIVFVV
jgi:hypothetical protein